MAEVYNSCHNSYLSIFSLNDEHGEQIMLVVPLYEGVAILLLSTNGLKIIITGLFLMVMTGHCRYCDKPLDNNPPNEGDICEGCRWVIKNFEWTLECDCSENYLYMCRECAPYREIIHKWKREQDSSLVDC